MLPPLPPHAAHVWRHFIDLRRTATPSGIGPARITRHDIRVWEQDEGVELAPWERAAILNLDAAYVRSTSADPTTQPTEEA